MGVPKFFRWISERYPCLSELVKEYQIPEFDNLYLDMNGIIHMCSHPNDFDPHFRITEEKIFKDIFHYIEILFRMIQPRKLFFMAVDGVAPRAKMNQQRGRRFRSAKEAEILEQKAKERGEALPSEARFDSNCITPGTEFMARLQEQLKYFVTYKMSSDSQWRDVKVILSGHETPGEGEHKIMDYIRYMKAQPGYDPNTRHCLYGLDADLIMLGLCSHEPHFSLLREEVKYGRKAKQTRTSTPEETRFFLLHLSLMREYLELEFVALKNSLSFPFDVEKIIDDWVLMGFLVGNDFIPPLPDMHIINGALPTLYKAYIDVLPTLGGYINEAGTLNLDRFRKYMEKLSAFDVEQFRETYADLKYFQAKTGRRMGGKERHSYKNSGGKDSDDLEDEIKPVKNPELAALIQNTDKELMGDEDDGDDDDDDDDSYESIDEDEDSAMFYMEFHQHKKDYYMNKLEYTTVNSEVLTSQADGYVRAIQWNLHYYYNGVCSWSWFYPHHYAPYISDICKFSKDLELKFDMGKPFLPFQQLLAVLPAASKKLLPKPYQQLMIEENSPIFHYYPSDFKTDLNGKKQEWEAVVLIPFIDEVSLLDAMAPCDALLTEEEKQRNSHGPMHIYTYTEEDLGVYQPPEHFPPVKQNRAAVVRVSREEIHVEPSLLVKGLCPGVRLDVYFPGFPTLKHIPHKAKMSKNKVKVFEQPSMGTNMILQIVDQKKPDLSEMSKLLGQSIYVAWPHLIEARVVAVSSREIRYAISDNPNEQFHSEQMSGALVSMWNSQRRGIQEHYASRLGVEIGETIIIVHATPMIGRKYVFGQMGKITLEKQWADMPTAYALQTTVQDIAVHDKSFVQYRTLQEVFPPKSVCFMLGHPHYGAMGEVVEGGGGTVKSGRVKVNMSVMPEPNLDSVRKQHQDNILAYMPGSVAAQYLGVSSHLISRITGTIYIVKGDKEASMDSSGKVNVGLNLKFNKKNEEIPGYTRKEGTLWQYSTKAVTLCHDYMQKFPELFDYLHKYTGNDVFYESDVFPSNEDKVTEIADWLKEQPYTKIERHATGSEVLDLEEVQAIEKEVDTFHQSGCRMKTVVMQVKPHLLYKPDLHIGNLPPDPEAQYRLFDRIVNVRDSYTVPLGLKGIIIGIHQAENEADIMYDVVFDKPFPGGLSVNCSDSRGYRVPRAAILNLSHGQRVEQKKTANKPTAVVQPSGNGLLPTPWNQGRPIGMTTGPQGNSAFASWNSKQQAPVPNMPNQAFFRAIQQQPQRIGNTAPPLPAFSQVPPRQANLFACPVAKVGSSAPGQVTSPPSEFQAIWSQLQKGQPSPQKQSQPQPPPVPPPSAAPGPPGNSKTLKIGGDTGTELLKKMLRISDEPTQGAQQQQKRPPQQQQQQNTKPVSVEQIFQNAARGNKEQPAYVQLLNYFQQNGLEIPRYTYTNSIDNGKVRAQVMLPDMRAITGEFMPNREQASESAARLALNQLAKEPLRKNDLHKPGTNTLPIPPQQWYHPQRQDPGVDWRRMTYHAPPPQPFMFQQFPQQQPWPRGNNMQNNPQNWRQQPRQQQQEWHGNWRQETRQEPKQESPQKQFVPLQAVKQQRNSKRQTQQPQSTDPAPSEKSNSNNRNPAPTEAAANSKPNNQVPEGGRPNSSVAKPVISRPRKPRLAANFQHNIDLQ